MISLTNLKLTSSLQLLLCVASLFFLSCKKEPTPFIEEIYGMVVNRVDGAGVPTMEVTLTQAGLSTTGLINRTYTDGLGKFQFIGYPNNLLLDLPGCQVDYQDMVMVWVNGTIDSLFSGYMQLNSVSPAFITLELYPNTFFKILVTNVVPAAANDIIIITIKNMFKTGQTHDKGVHSFQFNGLATNIKIEGETKFENILTIEYKVITDTGTEQFSRTVECAPGMLTNIEINY